MQPVDVFRNARYRRCRSSRQPLELADQLISLIVKFGQPRVAGVAAVDVSRHALEIGIGTASDDERGEDRFVRALLHPVRPHVLTSLYGSPCQSAGKRLPTQCNASALRFSEGARSSLPLKLELVPEKQGLTPLLTVGYGTEIRRVQGRRRSDPEITTIPCRKTRSTDCTWLPARGLIFRGRNQPLGPVEVMKAIVARCMPRWLVMAILIAVGCSNNPDQAADESLTRQFPELAGAVNDSDRWQASREIGRTDGNGDGIVTEAEWTASGYQPADRFKLNDINGDGILTPFEHSLRWAQYRTWARAPIAEKGSQELMMRSTERPPRERRARTAPRNRRARPGCGATIERASESGEPLARGRPSSTRPKSAAHVQRRGRCNRHRYYVLL